MSSSTFIAALRGDASLLAPGPRILTPERVADVHRARLLAGMAEAAAEKGYGATTIADVVARAQVSRRTFYEHFADRDECFLAAYEAASALVIDLIAQAVNTSRAPGWRERIAEGVSVYLHTLASDTAVTRLFLIDVLAAGPEALRRRRAVHQRFADLIQDLAQQHQGDLPPGYEIGPEMANALIGAFNELVLLALEEGRGAELPRYAETANRLLLGALAPAP